MGGSLSTPEECPKFQCDAGQVHDGTKCRAEASPGPSFDCQTGYLHDGTDCIEACPVGQFYADGRCVAVCDASEVFVNGACESTQCPAGQMWDGAECVQGVDVSCATGQLFDPSKGQCVSNYCPSGQTYDDASGACAPLADDTPVCSGENTYLDTTTNTCQGPLFEPSKDAPEGVAPGTLAQAFQCSMSGGLYQKTESGAYNCSCGYDGTNYKAYDISSNECKPECSPNETMGEDGTCTSKFAHTIQNDEGEAVTNERPHWLRLCSSEPNAENLARVSDGNKILVSEESDGKTLQGNGTVAGLSGVRFRKGADDTLFFAEERQDEKTMGMTVEKATQQCDRMQMKHLEDPSFPPCYGVNAVAQKTPAAKVGLEAPLKYCLNTSEFELIPPQGRDLVPFSDAMKEGWNKTKTLQLSTGETVHTRETFMLAKKAISDMMDGRLVVNFSGADESEQKKNERLFNMPGSGDWKLKKQIPGSDEPNGCSAQCTDEGVWEERIYKQLEDGTVVPDVASEKEERRNEVAAIAEADGFTAMCGLKYEYRPITRNGANGDLMSERVDGSEKYAHSIVRISPSEKMKSDTRGVTRGEMYDSCVDMAKQQGTAWSIELEASVQNGQLRNGLVQDSNMCYVTRCNAMDPTECYETDGNVLDLEDPRAAAESFVNTSSEETAGLLFRYQPAFSNGGTCVNKNGSRTDTQSSSWVQTLGDGECTVAPFHRDGQALRTDLKSHTVLRSDASTAAYSGLLCGAPGSIQQINLNSAIDFSVDSTAPCRPIDIIPHPM